VILAANLFFAVVVLLGLAWMVVIDLRRQHAYNALQSDLIITAAALQQCQAELDAARQTITELQDALDQQKVRTLEAIHSAFVRADSESG